MLSLQDNAPVVLVGSPKDDHIQAIAHALRQAGVPTFLLNAQAFPDKTRITLGDSLEEIWVDRRPLPRPGAVYIRNLYGSPLAFDLDAHEAMSADWHTTLVAFREKNTVLSSLLHRWEALGVPMYNPMSSAAFNKPLQISLLHQAGLPVPKTLWTNDPEAVRGFAQDRRIAYKPVAGGAPTQELGRPDLSARRLVALRAAPVTFQELLPGDDVRVYVIDGEVVAALRIVSSALDFRQNEELIEQIELPATIIAICVRATEVTGLRWTGMDLKVDAQGNLRILELNGSAMFLGFDAIAGTRVLAHLAAALKRAASGTEEQGLQCGQVEDNRQHQPESQQ